MIILFDPWQSDSQLHDDEQTEKNLECLHTIDFYFLQFLLCNFNQVLI